MPDPSHSIGGDNVHESKVRTSPSQEEVQSWKKDDDDHGEADEHDRQQGVHLAHCGVALSGLDEHLDEVEHVDEDCAEAEDESTIADEGRSM